MSNQRDDVLDGILVARQPNIGLHSDSLRTEFLSKPETDRFDDLAQHLEAAAARTAKIASTFYNALSTMPAKPKSATVKFGIKLQAGGRIIIVSGQAEAELNVAISWD